MEGRLDWITWFWIGLGAYYAFSYGLLIFLPRYLSTSNIAFFLSMPHYFNRAS